MTLFENDLLLKILDYEEIKLLLITVFDNLF